MAVWEHSTLGHFTFEEYLGWVGTAELPRFAMFTYRPRKQTNPSSTVPIHIATYDESELPTGAVIRVACKTLTNIDQLLDDALAALFRDFAGEGPDSGMWWHDDMEHVLEILSGSSRLLASVQDLPDLLGAPSILIQESGYGYDAACAIMGFESPIDEEHGIGFITDGETILGTGYRSDVSPFN